MQGQEAPLLGKGRRLHPNKQHLGRLSGRPRGFPGCPETPSELPLRLGEQRVLFAAHYGGEKRRTCRRVQTLDLTPQAQKLPRRDRKFSSSSGIHLKTFPATSSARVVPSKNPGDPSMDLRNQGSTGVARLPVSFLCFPDQKENWSCTGPPAQFKLLSGEVTNTRVEEDASLP